MKKRRMRKEKNIGGVEEEEKEGEV